MGCVRGAEDAQRISEALKSKFTIPHTFDSGVKSIAPLAALVRLRTQSVEEGELFIVNTLKSPGTT
jgi:hypothetical protein